MIICGSGAGSLVWGMCSLNVYLLLICVGMQTTTELIHAARNAGPEEVILAKSQHDESVGNMWCSMGLIADVTYAATATA